MKHTRLAAAVTTLSIAALALTGCSSSGGSSTSLDAQHPTGTVQFWTRSVLSAWTTKTVNDFNKTHKDLKVQVTPINDAQFATKLSAALRTNNVPDLVAADPGPAMNYIATGNFLDITSKLKSSGLIKTLAGPQLDQAELNGKYYGTPAALDASVLLYNKDLFSQAGISKAPTSVADMLADAKAIRALGSNTYGITFAGDCAGCLGFTALPNFWTANPMFTGTDLHNQKATVKGNAGLQKTLQFYRDVWTGGLAPASDQSENGATWGKDFQSGNIGMMPAPMGTYATAPAAFQSKIGIAPLPTLSGGISTFIGGANFSITKKSKNPAGAWEFMEYALSKQAQETLPDSGFAPVRSDVLSDPAFVAKNPTILPELKASKTGMTLKTLYQTELFNDAAGPFLAMFNKAVFQGDIPGAMDQAQTSFANILSGNGS
jgi:multiple sugar transport system substrate-binding protein